MVDVNIRKRVVIQEISSEISRLEPTDQLLLSMLEPKELLRNIKCLMVLELKLNQIDSALNDDKN